MLNAFIDTLLLQLKKNISDDERKDIIIRLKKLEQTFEIDLPSEIERRDDDAGSDDKA